jgi:hypothetical protein
MDNLHNYASYIALNEAAASVFTMSSICDDLRKKRIVTAKTPAKWVIRPAAKLMKGEKAITGSVMVNGKPIGTTPSIASTDKISCQDCTIKFDDIQGFGQAELVVKGGVPTLSITTE